MPDRWCLEAGYDAGLGAFMLAAVADMRSPILTERGYSGTFSAQCAAGCIPSPLVARMRSLYAFIKFSCRCHTLSWPLTPPRSNTAMQEHSLRVWAEDEGYACTVNQLVAGDECD
jgi:hypothetical protein